MTRLSVIGNISRDLTSYPDGRRSHQLGGAALHTALAASHAGADTALVSVIGQDLAPLARSTGHPRLDWSMLCVAPESSAIFTLIYDEQDRLVSTEADYGAAAGLTSHAIGHIVDHVGDFFHLSLRRPLQPEPVLAQLVAQRAGYSVDLFLPSAADMIHDAGPWLPRAAVVFCNTAEYRLLAAACDPTELPLVAVTDGPSPARLLRHGRLIVEARPPQATPSEVTGAGDTFAGTFLARWLDGRPAAHALASAVHAAARHLTTPAIPLPPPHHL
ncbi:carbohydrate kinase family protein [Streptomyces sp. NPDC097981]|uniref:carbohydrate kinase family protein n=1 Tax=Streptomyces sp. NPDC097981 TaxID=3155428 RepID=UPI00331F59A4